MRFIILPRNKERELVGIEMKSPAHVSGGAEFAA